MRYPRPNLIEDKKVPIVITALFDVSGTLGITRNPPSLLLLRRSEKVAYLKNTWSMPAGVIDNLIVREHGTCLNAALLQSQAELAGELFLFPDDLRNGGFLCEQYLRVDPDNGKEWDTFLVIEQTVHPEKVYCNWEHDSMLWVPVQEILEGALNVNPVTPNLHPDLERLGVFMQDLVDGKL